MGTSRTPIYASWDACVPHTEPWLGSASIGVVSKIAAGTVLYSQGEMHDKFYLIRQGFVQAAMVHANGRRLMLELMGPGTMFGEGAAFEGSPRFVEARAVTDSELSAYTPSDVLAAGSEAVRLLQSIVRIMGTKQRILANKLLQFSSEDPESRLRDLLSRILAVQRRAPAADGVRPNQVWISQERLGEMCGMSRISAARALRRLSDAGIIRTHAKFVEVIDPEALATA